MTLKNVLIKYAKNNSHFDMSDILYGLKRSYRYFIGFLFLKCIISFDNVSTAKLFICKNWKFLFKISIVLIFIISCFDLEASILLLTIVLIQNCYR